MPHSYEKVSKKKLRWPSVIWDKIMGDEIINKNTEWGISPIHKLMRWEHAMPTLPLWGISPTGASYIPNSDPTEGKTMVTKPNPTIKIRKVEFYLSGTTTFCVVYAQKPNVTLVTQGCVSTLYVNTTDHLVAKWREIRFLGYARKNSSDPLDRYPFDESKGHKVAFADAIKHLDEPEREIAWAYYLRHWPVPEPVREPKPKKNHQSRMGKNALIRALAEELLNAMGIIAEEADSDDFDELADEDDSDSMKDDDPDNIDPYGHGFEEVDDSDDEDDAGNEDDLPEPDKHAYDNSADQPSDIPF
jgi:hypothetical protein